MVYQIFPEPQSLLVDPAVRLDLTGAGPVWCSAAVRAKALDDLLPDLPKGEVRALPGFVLGVGDAPPPADLPGTQGYRLIITDRGLGLFAGDALGFRYGADSLAQILRQAKAAPLEGLDITDEPVLKQRGLMLDVSRGKVYTPEHLARLVELLARFRYNILQLYTEHTFEFTGHPDISSGSGAYSAQDILELSRICRAHGIELQANLQSLGHMRRILTRPAYQHLAESDLYWSLNTTDEASYTLLDELYGEYLPLFAGDRVNVCCDEPYDLGRGKSRSTDARDGELYFRHLLRVHALAARYGKKIMLFGDVIRHYPELARQLPEDVIFLDWIYDPKDHYDTPALFSAAGRPFWVSPGTGNWNTLFPRLDGALKNIAGLTLEGIAHGAEGMLLTDWNDHGGYTQPAPAWYSYAYAAATAWQGNVPDRSRLDEAVDEILGLPGYSAILADFGKIYHLPPIWSQNRSQCVMALFDEPIRGAAVCGPEVPPGLAAFDLALPPGIDRVYERHSHHPMRPVFKIPETTRAAIRQILDDLGPRLEALPPGLVKEELTFIKEAFDLMLAKLDASHAILRVLDQKTLDQAGCLSFEDRLDELIRRYFGLEAEFKRLWLAVARPSEIHRVLAYYSQIITRLDYLKDWISLQREALARGLPLDWTRSTYETGGYTTLPTY